MCEYYEKGRFNSEEYEREGRLRRKILSYANALFWGSISLFPLTLLALKLAIDASWMLLSALIGLFLLGEVLWQLAWILLQLICFTLNPIMLYGIIFS